MKEKRKKRTGRHGENCAAVFNAFLSTLVVLYAVRLQMTVTLKVDH